MLSAADLVAVPQAALSGRRAIYIEIMAGAKVSVRAAGLAAGRWVSMFSKDTLTVYGSEIEKSLTHVASELRISVAERYRTGGTRPRGDCGMEPRP